MTKLAVSALVIMFLAGACAHKRYKGDRQADTTVDGVVTVGTDWIKDKGGKFDVMFKVKNVGDKPFLMMVSDVECSRGEVSGAMTFKALASAGDIVELRPGELRESVGICKLDTDGEGPFKITIKRIYDNPAKDGKTPGKIVASNVTWKQSDPDKP